MPALLALALACSAGTAPRHARSSRADSRYPDPPVFQDEPWKLSVAQDDDDGVERDGAWHPDGDDDVDVLADGTRIVFRFHLDRPMEGAPVLARLVLPARPDVAAGTELRIRAVTADDGTPFAEKLASARGLSSTSVSWTVERPWTDPFAAVRGQGDRTSLQCAPFERISPDLTPLLAETGRSAWITLVLEPVAGSFAFQDRVDVADDECPGHLSARLEIFPTLRSTFTGKELVGRPTDTSATLTVGSLVATEVFAEYGPTDTYGTATSPRTSPPGVPASIALEGLEPDREIHYRLRFRQPGAAEFASGPDRTFHTARPRGEPFTFTATADGHYVNMEHRRAYKFMALLRNTMENVALDRPDFHVDLGDTFNTESYRSFDAVDPEEAARRVAALRQYFELANAPVLLALGNHEGEQGWRIAAGDPVPGLSMVAREAWFPNPTPGPFYEGNEADPASPQDYYAFVWGDVLVVVVDPYRYTERKPHEMDGTPGSGDRWDWTLGRAQYDWLARTLASSDATFKLVFSHQVTGGTNEYGRGGRPALTPGKKAEGSYEWGGTNDDGTPGFDEHRPGWGQPIHALLAQNHVTAFVHGHDHLFVFEPPLDGVGYITVPQPGDADYQKGHADRSGYSPGSTLIENSGHVRFSVSADALKVEYVRSFLPGGDGANRSVAFSYAFLAH